MAAIGGLGCSRDRSAGEMPCEDLTAEDVCYSDEFAGPAAETVQEGLDELAARAVPDVPLSERIYVRRIATPAGLAGNPAAGCWAGDVLLGGGCAYIEPGTRNPDDVPIMRTHGRDPLFEAWRCEYEFPNGHEPAIDKVIVVTAICLKLFFDWEERTHE
jgi:hypothetical protein